MQFKYPELLWGLLLLIIPILIHLFQLRKFKKTAFTNVAMLQKVQANSRKSNLLKKWLLLVTRLLLLGCLVIAFAQPFLASKKAMTTQEIVVYIDNSFSMQAKDGNISLLEKAVQGFIQNLPDKASFSLFTNTDTYKNVRLDAVENQLLQLSHTAKQLTKNEIKIKANSLFTTSKTTLKQLLVFSDFQNRLKWNNDSIPNVETYLVPLRPEYTTNYSLDSLYLVDNAGQKDLKILASGIPENENVPVSLYNKDKLIAKTAISGVRDGIAETTITLTEKDAISGKLVLDDNGLQYDNQFYFSINAGQKIKVLALSEGTGNFLNRIYTNDEFDFNKQSLAQANYSAIAEQHLIILNNLEQFPDNLIIALKSFKDNGGSIVLIPSVTPNISSYNRLLSSLGNLSVSGIINSEQQINTIVFEHPIYKNVFSRNVSNFDAPTLQTYIDIKGSGSAALKLNNGKPFLLTQPQLYIFTASFEPINNNFTNSPLIVPSLYNMGLQSFKLPPLYFKIGTNAKLDVPYTLEENSILSLQKSEAEFIPLQQVYANFTSLDFKNGPEESGTYTIKKEEEDIGLLSFNYARQESKLNYTDVSNFKAFSIAESIPNLFYNLEQDRNIVSYWKWFVIFALVFALLEILIQKFIK
ncbi:BatA domain-containing protein [Flavobacterium sp. ASW18X]|uniref:BatA domain-containing protein n=1 Tax=Flavobacterium sp. ASW18X TaxID=2572595 RepID=UPI0010AE7EBA|nr:BatA domain-containing protein [Flavobacterium sp. ASW18X]TKD66174.1 hypothetical protein FBT53_04690 [Flavobacterium sp. ASW18X]